MSKEVGEADGLSLSSFLHNTRDVGVHTVGTEEVERTGVYVTLEFLLEVQGRPLGPLGVGVQLG